MSFTKKSSIFLLLLCLLPLSYAVTCQNSTPSNLYLENARPYTAINNSFTLRAYYQDTAGNSIQGNETNLTISFGGNTYGMTNYTSYWEITLLSSISEDVTFLVQANNSYYACKAITFTGKWRTPYNVIIKLYKESLNLTTPDQYINDFHYIVLVNNNEKNSYSMSAWAFNRGVANSINWLTGWIPGQKPLQLPDNFDNNIYFWGKYGSGQATIKLYEPGNYTIYAMNNKVEYPTNYFWEFERPTTKDVEYMGNIYDHLQAYDQTNVSNTPNSFNNSVIKVSLSKVEANTYYVAMNIIQIIIVVAIFIAGLIGAIWLASQTQSAAIIGYYIVIAGSIALGFILYIR